MWAWWWIGQLESRSVERGCFHGHCTYTIYSYHKIILSSLVVRSSWVLLQMTAVSCSDFLQRLFMNKTQHHFIHYKLAGCFAIIIQQFKAISWVMFILHYILYLAFYGFVLFQICYFHSFFIHLINCLKFVPKYHHPLLPWHHPTTCQASPASSATASSLRWLRETWRPTLRLAPESAVSRPCNRLPGGRGWCQMMAFFDRLFSSQSDLFANFWLENPSMNHWIPRTF